MADLFDNKNLQKGYLDNINDVVFLLKRGYSPNRLLVFYKVSDNILTYLLALMATSPLRSN